MIMSALALGLAGGLAPAAESQAKRGFWSRFIEARQQRVDRAIYAHLAAMSDMRLNGFGFDREAVRALRTGEFVFPQTKQEG
jgi:hypothetical protein